MFVLSKEEKPGIVWPSPRTTGIQNSQSVRQGCVPNQKPPFLCHSRKHRLKDWGSGDLLLLSGLCPKGPCHPLSQGSLTDEGLEMLVSQWLHKDTSPEQ